MGASLKEMVVHLNDLSRDIYGEELRLSVILAQGGLSAEQLVLLQSEKLEALLDNLDFALQSFLIPTPSGFKVLDVIYRRYGLFGRDKLTLEAIGNQMGLSKERIRQLQEKGVRRLRGSTFKLLAATAAYRTLDIREYHQILSGFLAKQEIPFISADHSELEGEARSHVQIPVSPSLLEYAKAAFFPSVQPLSLTKFIQTFNHIKPEELPAIGYRFVLRFLFENSLLEECTLPDGSSSKRPTKSGNDIGIITEDREGARGSYTVILYTETAQQFILNNFNAILEIRQESGTVGRGRWSRDEEEKLTDLFKKGAFVSEMAKELNRTPKAIRSRLKKLCLIERRGDAK